MPTKPKSSTKNTKSPKSPRTKKPAPRRELPTWHDRNLLEKILYVAVFALAIAVIVAFFVDLFSGLEFISSGFYFGALSLALLADAAIYWKYNRPTAVAMLICGVVLVITTIIAIAMGL